MELIDKIFKPLILLATLVWFVLAATQALPVQQLLIYIGILSVAMGVRNLLILNVSQRTNHFHEKIQVYIDRYGLRKGLIRYSVVLVVSYLVIGVMLIVLNI